MPIQRVTKNGKPAYRYGDEGKAYTYSAGNVAGRKRAKRKAIQQGLAIARRQGVKPHF
jgi:hypothetical protein